MPGEHVPRRDVSDGAVQTNVVVMLYVTLTSPKKISKEKRIQVLARHILGATELRLLNGMNPPVPEVTVLIHRITKDRRPARRATA
jgi:hypothetical protein